MGVLATQYRARQGGVVQDVTRLADDGRAISAFREKPTDAKGLPDAPDQVFASMGNYVFRADALIEAVSLDAKDEDSKHDLGGNIIPMLVASQEAEVYDFADNDVPGATDRDRGYWRDVGTLDAYYEAHMDLISVHPVFNLYNRKWPILTWHQPLPPAKFVFESGEGRTGHALDSMVSAGVVVSGGTVWFLTRFEARREPVAGLPFDLLIQPGVSDADCVAYRHLERAEAYQPRRQVLELVLLDHQLLIGSIEIVARDHGSVDKSAAVFTALEQFLFEETIERGHQSRVGDLLVEGAMDVAHADFAQPPGFFHDLAFELAESEAGDFARPAKSTQKKSRGFHVEAHCNHRLHGLSAR